MMRTHGLVVVLFTLATAVVALGQSRFFDVVSVKRSSDPATRMVRPDLGQVRPGGVWVSTDVLLVSLIRYAYPGHALRAQLVGGPEWAERDLFDVEGRTTPDATVDDMRQMVRAMLADRFRLALHIERRDVTGYALVRRGDGRLGTGITTPAFDCDAYRAAKARGETPREDPARAPYGDRLSCVAVAMPVIEHMRLIPG